MEDQIALFEKFILVYLKSLFLILEESHKFQPFRFFFYIEIKMKF